MRLEKLKFLVFGLLLLTMVLSCSKDYLEVEPKGTLLEDNYYKNGNEAYSGLIAIYDELGKGIITNETKKRYLRIIEDLITNGAEGIVLGCTEIPLVVQQSDI